MSEDMKNLEKTIKSIESALDEKLNDAAQEQRVKGIVDPLLNETTDKIAASFAEEVEKLQKQNEQAEARAKSTEAKVSRLAALGADEGGKASEIQGELREKFYGGFIKGKVDEHAYGDFVNANAELKALTVADDARAGYMLAPATLEAEVARIVTETSPVRNFASVRTTNTLDYERRVRLSAAAAVWEDSELDSTTEQDAQEYRKVKISANGLRAYYVAGPNMLDDAFNDIEAEMAEEAGIQFAVAEGSAFINGVGAGQPRGFLTYTNTASGSYTGAWEQVEYRATGADGAFASSTPDDVFIDTIHDLKDAYRNDARFYMNRGTLAAVRKIRDADNRPLFSWDSGMPPSIAGEPFSILQDMPDIASGSFSIAYANLNRGYQITDRAGMSVIRDPYSQKPSVEFLFRKRVGGAVKMFEAVKLIKFGTS